MEKSGWEPLGADPGLHSTPTQSFKCYGDMSIEVLPSPLLLSFPYTTLVYWVQSRLKLLFLGHKSLIHDNSHLGDMSSWPHSEILNFQCKVLNSWDHRGVCDERGNEKHVKERNSRCDDASPCFSLLFLRKDCIFSLA